MELNLKKRRAARGWTQDQLADVLGVSKTHVSEMESGKKNPSQPVLARLAEAFGVSLAEMVGGDPAPIVVHSGDEPPGASDLVNVWDVEASAGHGAVVPDYETVAYRLAFPPGYLRTVTTSDPGNLEIITVKGRSMIPTLDNDDIVMIDRQKRSLGYDGVFVLMMDETLHVKRVGRASSRGRIRIISDNKTEFPEFERSIDDVDVLGKVVWAGKRM
jgi:phage repressor protein C with HTH and peptisase S24 domain